MKKLIYINIIIVLFIITNLIVPLPTAYPAPVISVTDPEGDDRGPGYYGYPAANVFKPGVFDLTKFEVYDEGGKVIFKVYVKDLGGNPWNAPNGFSLQYVHIYVRTTAPLPTRTDTIGLNVLIKPEYAWHFALLLAPGWGSDPVPAGEKAALYYSNDTVIVQDDKAFKVYADPARNAIVAEVAKELLPDVGHISDWVYIVALTSYDGYGPMRIRPFGVEAGEWVIGVGKEHALAVLYNVVPRIMDLLAPTAEEQYAMLGSYKIDREKGIGAPAKIRGYGGRALVAGATVTVTETTRVTETTTLVKTLYSTTVETVTESKATTETVAATITSSVTMFIVGLIIGLLIPLFIRKKLRLK